MIIGYFDPWGYWTGKGGMYRSELSGNISFVRSKSYEDHKGTLY